MFKPDPMSTSEFDKRKRAHTGRSLNRVFLGVLLIAMLLPAIVCGFWLIRAHFDKAIAKDYIAVAQHYGSVLESGMMIPLWNLSPAMGKPVLESVSADRSVVSIEVLLEGGKTFLEFQRFENVDAADVIEIERPVLYDEVQLGRVKLAYSLERAREQSFAQTHLLVKVLLVQAFVVLIVMFLLWRAKVSLPLAKLMRSLDRLVAGDLNQSVPKSGSAEFALLSTRLESMRVAVSNEIVLLERRVDERTKELSSLNATLSATLEQLHYTYDALVQSDKLSAFSNILIDTHRASLESIGHGRVVINKLLEQHKAVTQITFDQLSESTFHQYSARAEEGLTSLNANIIKVSDLLADIDKATVENAYLGRQQSSLFNLLKDTCRAMAPAIQRTPYKVILEFNDKNDVQLDSFPHALGQVFQNIISNALLHAFEARSHGEIVISANRRDESVDILFADNGVGMSSDHQEQVFDRFFSTKSDHGEMGLGMYIVKMLATKVLGGDVSVDSTPNTGTTVVLSVPLNAPAEQHKSTLDTHSDSA